jgi:starvation-inducible DNA-binding protein
MNKTNNMFQTKNDLDQKTRVQVSKLLQERLADSVDLLAQIKHAHWNVKGPSFIALHLLFDQIWKESQEYADLIAERIAQFGGRVDGTVQGAAKTTSLDKYPLESTDGRQHVEALSHALATYGELVRKAIDQCDELKDAGTADIFTEISRGIDKNLWFVEAHLQTPK